jgi:hypothetical protein
MNNPETNADLATLLKTLVDKVEQIDRRTNAIATAPSRYYLDAPEAAPTSARGKRPAPPPPKSLADQIYDLISDEPRTEPDLARLLPSDRKPRARSSINQAVNELVKQRRAVVISTGRGKGSMNVVFHPSQEDPFEWLFKRMGWARAGS